MSAPGSGPYEGTGEDADRARPPARGRGPLVQVPSGPLVRDDATDRAPRIEFGAVSDKVAERFGLDPVTFEGRCPLPGHTGSARLASGLPEDRYGDVRLLCCRGRWRSLGDVRASIAYGFDDGGRKYEDGGRSNILLATWTRRLAYEVGAFRPAAVAVPPLPSGASPGIERVWEGFRLLIGLRWADGPHRPVAFSAGFARAWCGVARGTAHAAIRFLIERGVIWEVERRGRLRFYLPGPIPEEADEARANDEAALIARLIAEFDAEELPPDSPDDGEVRP